MTDQTPSPQSVVVPVEPTEAMIEAGRMAGCIGSSVAGLVFDAMLSAAPAPSSLAGRERYGDETAEQIVRRWADWINDVSSDMDEPEWGGKTHNDVLNERDFLVRILASLSPEAPARIVGTIAHVSNGRSELAAQITAALTPRHEAPASEGDA